MSKEVPSGDIIVYGSIQGEGIAIGPSAKVEINKNFFYPVTLSAPKRKVFDGLIEDYMRLFGGRHDILKQIGEFIQRPTGGFLIITAPAGFGKTALMAALLESNRGAFAYHFFHRGWVLDSVNEIFFLQNIVEQMAQWHGSEELLPTNVTELRPLYHEFITRSIDITSAEPNAKRRLMILDGLDEISGWDISQYLHRTLPRDLYVILTIRDVGQDWQHEYRLNVGQLIQLRLHGLDRDEVAEVFRAAGDKSLILASDKRLLNAIWHKALYETDQHLGADPFYVHFLAEDAAQGRLVPDNIADQPQGLRRYFDEWWKQVIPPKEEQLLRDLFGILTAALGPIGRPDLEALIPSLVDDWDIDYFESLVRKVERVILRSEQDRYSLIHPRFQQYLRDKIRLAPYENRLLKYCADWRENHSPYALGYYVEHLNLVGARDELMKLFEDQTWMSARIRGSNYIYSGFLADLDILINSYIYPKAMAEVANGANLVTLPFLVRCMLLQASANSLTTTIPTELMKRALELRFWNLNDAISIASRLRGVRQTAAAAACIIDITFSRLSFGEQVRTLRALIRKDESYKEVILILLPHLTKYPEILHEILGRISLSEYTLQDIPSVIPYISEIERDALIAINIDNIIAVLRGSFVPSYIASQILPYVNGKSVNLILENALDMKYANERDSILRAIAPNLDKTDLIKIWQRMMISESVTYELFETLASIIAEDSIEEILLLTKNAQLEAVRARAFRALVPLLDDEWHTIILEDIRTNANQNSHQVLFEYQIKYLSDIFLQKAFDLAISSDDEHVRSNLLTILVQHGDRVDHSKISSYVLAHRLYSNSRLIEALMNFADDAFIQEVKQYVFDKRLDAYLDIAVIISPKLSSEDVGIIVEHIVSRKFMVWHWGKLARISPYLNSETQLMIIKEGYRGSNTNPFLKYLSHIDGVNADLAWNMAKTNISELIHLLNFFTKENRDAKIITILEMIVEQKGYWYMVNLSEFLSGDSVTRALTIVATLPRIIPVYDYHEEDSYPRRDALLALIPRLQTEHIPLALDIISELGRGFDEALRSITDIFPINDIITALDIDSSQIRLPNVWKSISPHLAAGLSKLQLVSTIKKVLRIDNDKSLIRTLTSLLPHLTPHLRSMITDLTLNMTISYRDNEDYGSIEKVHLIALVLPFLYGIQKTQILNNAYAIAQQVKKHSGVDSFPQNEALHYIVPFYPKEQRRQLVAKMFATIDAGIWEGTGTPGDTYGAATVRIAKVAEEEFIEKCLSVASHRLESLGDLIIQAVAPRVSEQQAQSALHVCLQFPDESKRTSSIISILPRLNPDLIDIVTESSELIVDINYRLLLKTSLIPYLQNNERDEASYAVESQLNKINSDLVLAEVAEKLLSIALVKDRQIVLEHGFEAAKRLIDKGRSFQSLRNYVQHDDRATKLILNTLINQIRSADSAQIEDIYSLISEMSKLSPHVIPQFALDEITRDIVEISQDWTWI